MTDAQFVGLFLALLFLMLPLSFLFTVWRRRRGHFDVPAPDVTDRMSPDAISEFHRHRANPT